MFYVFQEHMHQIALVPIFVLLFSFWRGHGARAWLLGFAFVVSWMMDSTNVFFISDGLLAVITQYGKPIMIALALAAVVKDVSLLPLLYFALVLAVAASAIQGVNTLEVVVPLLGGFAITMFARKSQTGPRRVGAIVYFGLGAIAWAGWSVFASEPTRMARITWYAFQGTRLAGILLITSAMVIHARKPRLELV